jgi:hypothetical protein
MAARDEETPLGVMRTKTTALLKTVFSLPAAVAVMIGLCMLYVYRTGGVEGDISDVAFARGLITLLFSVGTIAVAVVLTFAALFQNHDDAKERFDRGKQVLGILIGILGTIVGFYFGSLSPDAERPLIQSVSPTELTAGEDAEVAIAGEGFGSAPLVILGAESLPIKSHSANQVTASVPASQLSQAGNLQIRVINTTTGTTSNGMTISIVEAAESS